MYVCVYRSFSFSPSNYSALLSSSASAVMLLLLVTTINHYNKWKCCPPPRSFLLPFTLFELSSHSIVCPPIVLTCHPVCLPFTDSVLARGKGGKDWRPRDEHFRTKCCSRAERKVFNDQTVYPGKQLDSCEIWELPITSESILLGSKLSAGGHNTKVITSRLPVLVATGYQCVSRWQLLHVRS